MTTRTDAFNHFIKLQKSREEKMLELAGNGESLRPTHPDTLHDPMILANVCKWILEHDALAGSPSAYLALDEEQRNRVDRTMDELAEAGKVSDVSAAYDAMKIPRRLALAVDVMFLVFAAVSVWYLFVKGGVL